MVLRAARRDVEQMGTLAKPSQVAALGCGHGEDDDAPLSALQPVHGADEDATLSEKAARVELALDADALADERCQYRDVRRRDAIGDELR